MVSNCRLRFEASPIITETERKHNAREQRAKTTPSVLISVQNKSLRRSLRRTLVAL